MKKFLLRVALAILIAGGVVAVRQVVLDLSESERLWHPITDPLDQAAE